MPENRETKIRDKVRTAQAGQREHERQERTKPAKLGLGTPRAAARRERQAKTKSLYSTMQEKRTAMLDAKDQASPYLKDKKPSKFKKAMKKISKHIAPAMDPVHGATGQAFGKSSGNKQSYSTGKYKYNKNLTKDEKKQLLANRKTAIAEYKTAKAAVKSN